MGNLGGLGAPDELSLLDGVQLLEQITYLHGALTEAEFHEQLSRVLENLLARRDYSLLEVTHEQAVVRASSRVPGLRRRLNPPILTVADTLRLAQIDAGEANGRDHSAARASVQVESIALPIVEIWHLGESGPVSGYLVFHDEAECATGNQERALLVELKRNISIAFHKLSDQSHLHQQSELLSAKLSAINEIGEMLGVLDLDVLLTKLMELSLYVVNGQVGSIILVRHDESGQRIVESPIEWGLTLEMATCLRTRSDVPIYEQAIEDGQAVVLADFARADGYCISGMAARVDSYLCIPLVSKTRVLGVVNLVNCLEETAVFLAADREVLMTLCRLAATSIENVQLYRDSLEKERIQASLRIARDIQQRLYSTKAPALDWLDIASRSESCDETGGDYFDFVPANNNGMTLIIGDVSGHGIGAALHMVAARAGLRATLAHDAAFDRLTEALNTQLAHDMEIDQFMTLCMVSLAGPGRPLLYVNAGHDAPCVYRAATGKVEMLNGTGLPLGLFADASYTLGEAAGLDTGDVLLATTDGVWEVFNDEGQLLGKEALAEIFHRHAASGADSSQIASAILEEVGQYTGGRPARDDVTLVVLRMQ
ncbi:MAG: PP2C family protein-serine/threonine phosphatase [Planctomycetota bacterium]